MELRFEGVINIYLTFLQKKQNLNIQVSYTAALDTYLKILIWVHNYYSKEERNKAQLIFWH